MKARLITALLAAAVVAAGVGVNALEEGRSATQQIPTAVHVGQDSSVSSMSVHLHGVRAVGDVAGSGGEALPTSGVWVVVDMSYAAHTRPTYLSSLMLVDDQGRQWERSRRVPATLPMAEADLWQRGEVAFEVPSDALGEMILEIYVESRWLVAPVRFGRAGLTVDADGIDPGLVEIQRAELLPAGER